MSRANRRVARVKDLPIAELLTGYGYPIHGGNREEQFPCDLHGDGLDNKPSGRFYPESNTVYCFTCDKTRDTIELVREKQGLDFWGAVKFLEQKFGLPALPWEADDKGSWDATSYQVKQILGSRKTFEDTLRRLTNVIQDMRDFSIPMSEILTFWEARDKLAWKFAKQQLSEDQARAAADVLRQRILALISRSPG